MLRLLNRIRPIQQLRRYRSWARSLVSRIHLLMSSNSSAEQEILEMTVVLYSWLIGDEVGDAYFFLALDSSGFVKGPTRLSGRILFFRRLVNYLTFYESYSKEID